MMTSQIPCFVNIRVYTALEAHSPSVEVITSSADLFQVYEEQSDLEPSLVRSLRLLPQTTQCPLTMCRPDVQATKSGLNSLWAPVRSPMFMSLRPVHKQLLSLTLLMAHLMRALMCVQSHHQMQILPDQSVVPCCSWMRDFGLLYDAGSSS